MKNSTTTKGIHSQKEENSRKNPKSVLLSLNDKIVDALSSFMSQLLFSMVVALFTQLIKIKSLACLSGFCYNKSEL
jgi:hypothetical protein